MPDGDLRIELIVLQSALRVLVPALADLDDEVRAALRDRFARELANHDPTKGEVMAAIHERLDQLLALIDLERPGPPPGPDLRLIRRGEKEE